MSEPWRVHGQIAMEGALVFEVLVSVLVTPTLRKLLNVIILVPQWAREGVGPLDSLLKKI